MVALEFPELVEATLEGAGEKTVLEVGCGAGNTVFPLLEINRNKELRIHACDYSSEAVSVVRAQPLYADPPGGAYCLSSVWDLSSPTELPEGLEEGCVDIIVLIFVFSALHPRMASGSKEYTYPPQTGGIVLFRDYGRYDLPQLRFKKRRMLQDNFYLRGDGTRVYFFTPEELFEIFNAKPQTTTTTTVADEGETRQIDERIEGANGASTERGEEKEAEEEINETREKQYDFATTQMAIDRRLIVNRKERKQMYRVWLQAKFQILNNKA